VVDIICCVIECHTLRLQEQPSFMVVASYDDSLVFQFHKPSTSFAHRADPEFSCLVVPSIVNLICCRSYQALHTADVMWVYTLEPWTCHWLDRPDATNFPCFRLATSATAASHKPLFLPLHRSTRKRQLQKPRVGALSPLTECSRWWSRPPETAI
jgi:hypothetical protein